MTEEMQVLLKKELEAELKGDGTVSLSEPMAAHTTFRTGGCAQIYVTLEQASSYDSLIRLLLCLKKYPGIPFFILGRGSNLLVADDGYKGVVIDLSASYRKIDADTEHCRLTVQAGTTLSQTAAAALKYGMGGFEFAAGIPGTIGGAVVMNAGAYGGEMKDVLLQVKVLRWKDCSEPTICTLSLEELKLGYRKSLVMERGDIVLEACLQFAPKPPEAIRERMNELRLKRMEKQPLEYPSAGSTFKRPEGYYAGKLIMDAGLAGYRVGGAMVSPKHCGFVINYDHASSGDIYQLMQDVRRKVMNTYGVELEPEIRMLGTFEEFV